MEITPACVGIILDGNRRWAEAKGLPVLEGHREGAKRLKDCIAWCKARKITHLVVYAFSTENWQRPHEEVSYLMKLMQEVMAKEARTLIRDGVRARFVGQREKFSPSMLQMIEALEAESQKNEDITLWVCLSYGGRAEIVAAAQRAVEAGLAVTEDSLTKHLWTVGMPDPDLIIRTGARHRISNFLLWQSAYSELFFLDTLWPDFSEKDFDSVLEEFSERKRTFGV